MHDTVEQILLFFYFLAKKMEKINAPFMAIKLFLFNT